MKTIVTPRNTSSDVNRCVAAELAESGLTAVPNAGAGTAVLIAPGC